MVESARVLTGARYGVIATVDETGAPTRESVFSGFSPEEEQELFVWPGSGRLFEQLRQVPGPLRLADLAGGGEGHRGARGGQERPFDTRRAAGEV